MQLVAHLWLYNSNTRAYSLPNILMYGAHVFSSNFRSPLRDKPDYSKNFYNCININIAKILYNCFLHKNNSVFNYYVFRILMLNIKMVYIN